MVIEVVAAPAVRDPAPAAVRLLELLADPTRRRLSLLLMRGETGNGPCRRHPPKVGLSPCPGQADGKEEEVVRILEPPGSQAIMAVAAHPDDIESWCAGTLARAVDTGAVVRLLLVTSGDKGTADPNADPADVARLRAVYPLARDRLSFPEYAQAGLTPHAVRAVWLFASAIADQYVDIADGFERKLAARLAHTSQTSDAAALRVGWRQRAAAIGVPAGLALAEAFTVLRLDEGDDNTN